jgi:type I restriction enzyme S subunit
MAIAWIELATSQGFKSFSPTNGYSTEFIYYTVKNALKTITQCASGSTFKEVSGTVLKTVKITLPSSEIIGQFTNTVLPIFKR